MDPLDGLNERQREAAAAVRGPVCILAGAGTGKTTTITRRIANQLVTGSFKPRDLLALTFTDRAAREMVDRLAALGVGREVRAKTFHAEALWQVGFFREAPEILPSKGELVYPLVRRLPRPYRFRATKDVAGEIERAKNRRVTPDRYLDELGDHTPPIPPDLMVRVYRDYEQRKAKAGRADFEDLLEACIGLLTDDPSAAERVRARYQAFTVDEYQDVNLLQQTLLDAWLGDRDEVCVVGDDHQSIYGFTGATPRWLLDFPERFPDARVVALDRNYRSSQPVLDLANRLLGDRPLRSDGEGPQPVLVEHATGAEETDAIVSAIDGLASGGTAFEEMAILYRINARSEDYEEALSAARIPYQVRDGAFLRRPGPRTLLRRLQRADRRTEAAAAVEAAAREAGWEPDAVGETEDEETRLADLGRLVALALEYGGDVEGFLGDLRTRFEQDGTGRGVVLSTYHRAKGLEWDAVFLPRLEERELPFGTSKVDDELDEERRLLYVGITRARTHLRLSWARSRGGKSVRPSRFVRELLPKAERTLRPVDDAPPSDGPLFDRLREWRRRAAQEADVPAYVVFHDATLRAICDVAPRTLGELAAVAGVGPSKLERYGAAVLEIVADD